MQHNSAWFGRVQPMSHLLAVHVNVQTCRIRTKLLLLAIRI